MCGIFGVIGKTDLYTINKALLLSESRGKDASGVCIVTESKIEVLKSPLSASKFIHTPEYLELSKSFKTSKFVMGHARMETNGSFAKGYNNQPVIKNGIVSIHNGIIVNDKELWKANPDLKQSYEVDTEIINALIRKALLRGKDLYTAVHTSLGKLKGAYSLSLVFEDYNCLILATNTGSLYLYKTGNKLVFSSEWGFLKNLLEKNEVQRIQHIEPESIKIFDFNTLNELSKKDIQKLNKIREISLISDMTSQKTPVFTQNAQAEINQTIDYINQEYEVNHLRISKLKRCTKCLLPETVPFIEFNDKGVCTFCRHSKKLKYQGKAELEKLISEYKSTNGVPNCIIPFSGGRDSSYGLHYIKEELGLNPITFTYDWGMVTDLARRNIARMCGSLGVENILISADIQSKRENVRKNVMAWCKRPELGTVPLFMAGDKQFFYYVNKIKRDYNLNLNIWMANRMEETNFKSGFCGIKPDFDKKYIDSLKILGKAKIASFYTKEFLLNPSYLNTSFVDTLWAFFSYYFEPRNDYYLFYDFIEWDEKKIEKTLINRFDWETSPDTKSTWRIGDGTASFYNYIYYTLGGFTENDTFRSNQIRQGVLSREEGLKKVEEENGPRIDSLLWYCNTIGVSFKYIMKQINLAKKLY